MVPSGWQANTLGTFRDTVQLSYYQAGAIVRNGVTSIEGDAYAFHVGSGRDSTEIYVKCEDTR